MQGYWFCYDLSDNRERYQVEKILKRYGIRIQKSVFYCELTRNQFYNLKDNIDRINPVSGHLVIAPVPGSEKWETIGQAPAYMQLLAPVICIL